MPDSGRMSHRWTAKICVLLGVLLTTLLTGCAIDSNGSRTAYDDQNYRDSGSASWQYGRDPISEFMARQRGAQFKINPEDINNPLARHALTQLGIRYRFGGKSPDTGFDCSGLVFYSAQESLGLKLPPRSDDMAKLGSNIERNQLQVGDLVFFNTMGRRFSHVGVYLGDSKFVHSPASGGVVRIEDINERYWDKRFTGARRLDGAEFASANTGASLTDSAPILIPASKVTSTATNHSSAKNSQVSIKSQQTTTAKETKSSPPAKTAIVDLTAATPKAGKTTKTPNSTPVTASTSRASPTPKTSSTTQSTSTTKTTENKPKSTQASANPTSNARQP